MRGHELLDKMEMIDPVYVEAASVFPPKKQNGLLKRCAALAACLVLLLSAGFGTYAYAAEAKEYRAAVQFFEDYDLSMQGLTRYEIRMVYRDITSKSFSYSKTAEVFINSISSGTVEGCEILLDNPTSKDIAAFWEYYHEKIILDASTQSYYRIQNEYVRDEGYDYREFKGSYLEKYEGKNIVWRSATVSDFSIRHYHVVSDGVIAYGGPPPLSPGKLDAYASIVKFDKNGRIVWEKRLTHGFEEEYITEIVENADGSYAVFSRGDSKYFCLSQYSALGEEIHFRKTEIGDIGFDQVVPFDGGYIVECKYADSIMKVDYEGNILASFSYESEDEQYLITDMVVLNGQIYLSTYATRKDQNAPKYLYELSYVHHYAAELYRNEGVLISNEELTPMIRDVYTAVLLVCDLRTGKVDEFYSVPGAHEGKLSINSAGNLIWRVENIMSARHTPTRSFASFYIMCSVWQYTFDQTGALIGQKKTDEVTSFDR